MLNGVTIMQIFKALSGITSEIKRVSFEMYMTPAMQQPNGTVSTLFRWILETHAIKRIQ